MTNFGRTRMSVREAELYEASRFTFGPWVLWKGVWWPGDRDALVQVRLNTGDESDTHKVRYWGSWWDPMNESGVFIIAYRRAYPK